jgi:hypothetical protein
MNLKPYSMVRALQLSIGSLMMKGFTIDDAKPSFTFAAVGVKASYAKTFYI